MKPVKNFVYAALLATVMAVSVPAGELGTPGYVPTPSPTPEHAKSIICDPEIDYYCTPDAGSITTETSDSLFYEALAALLSVY